MNRRIFSCVMAIFFALCANAQDLSIKKDSEKPTAEKIFPISQKAQAPKTRGVNDYIWWGYPDGGGYVNIIGFDKLASMLQGGSILKGQKDYNIAMEVPKSFAGATIDSVSIVFWQPLTMRNLKVWLSEYKKDTQGNLMLPASAEEADYSFSVGNTGIAAQSYNYFALPENYTIPDSGCVVGYSFTDMVGSTPIVLHYTNGNRGGFYMQYSSNATTRQWIDGSGWGLGDLTISLHMEASKLTRNMVSIDRVFDDDVCKVGEKVTSSVIIKNESALPVENISYVIYRDGVPQPEQTANLSTALGYGTTGAINIELVGTTEGLNTYEIEITKTDGEANLSKDNKRPMNVIALNEFAKRTSVVEVFTGTWCGYCPRGIVGVNKLKNIYGNNIIILAGHSDDPMESNYYMDFMRYVNSGYPSAMFDRAYTADPYMGNNNVYVFGADKVVESISKTYPSEATMSIEALWTDNSKKEIKTVATPSFLYSRPSSNPYAVVFLLSEDGMTGFGGDWSQANYYVGETSITDPEMRKYVNGKSYMTETYNNVIVHSWEAYDGMTNGESDVKKGSSQPYHATLDISQNTIIQNKSNLSLTALLINRSTGRIVNAAQMRLTDATGIDGIMSDEDVKVIDHYNVNGIKTSSAKHGLNIVRLSSGKVVKVVK